MDDLKFCEIDIEYRKYMQKIEKKIELSTEEKDNRKFLGIVLNVNGLDYVVPLSSPKEKHSKMKNNIDFLKIKYKDQLIGVLNFNNMFPVPKGLYTILNVNNVSDVKYRDLLKNELSWCNEIDKREKIYKNAEKIYKDITLKKEKSVFWNRSCNFSLLEEKAKEYEKELNLIKEVKEQEIPQEKPLEEVKEQEISQEKSLEEVKEQEISQEKPLEEVKEQEISQEKPLEEVKDQEILQEKPLEEAPKDDPWKKKLENDKAKGLSLGR